MMISNVFLLLTRSLASAVRIARCWTNRWISPSPAARVAQVEQGSVDFENVSFKYHKDAQAWVLNGITLHIPAGSTVGILGGTGSAKSSLVQLIPRLYDATQGVVRVGGLDVKAYDLAALRDAVGIVLQKNLLFSGTVRDNLHWGDPQADDQRLWQACRAACAEEFLKAMPQGLDTDLGQGGVNLSGGQKQRLCIARALLKKAQDIDLRRFHQRGRHRHRGKDPLRPVPNPGRHQDHHRPAGHFGHEGGLYRHPGQRPDTRRGDHGHLLATDPIYQEIWASQMKGGVGYGAAV